MAKSPKQAKTTNTARIERPDWQPKKMFAPARVGGAMISLPLVSMCVASRAEKARRAQKAGRP